MSELVEPPKRLIVALTGASGTIFGVRLLQKLRGTGIETHLVMSRWAARTLVHETPYTPEQIQKLADVVHPLTDQGAPISSGSFITMGMIVVPCSARTLAAIAHGIGDNLIHRAADVVHHDLIVKRLVFKNLVRLNQKMRGDRLQCLADRPPWLQGRLLVHGIGGFTVHGVVCATLPVMAGLVPAISLRRALRP